MSIFDFPHLEPDGDSCTSLGRFTVTHVVPLTGWPGAETKGYYPWLPVSVKYQVTLWVKRRPHTEFSHFNQRQNRPIFCNNVLTLKRLEFFLRIRKEKRKMNRTDKEKSGTGRRKSLIKTFLSWVYHFYWTFEFNFKKRTGVPKHTKYQRNLGIFTRTCLIIVEKYLSEVTSDDLYKVSPKLTFLSILSLDRGTVFTKFSWNTKTLLDTVENFYKPPNTKCWWIPLLSLLYLSCLSIYTPKTY